MSQWDFGGHLHKPSWFKGSCPTERQPAMSNKSQILESKPGVQGWQPSHSASLLQTAWLVFVSAVFTAQITGGGQGFVNLLSGTSWDVWVVYFLSLTKHPLRTFKVGIGVPLEWHVSSEQNLLCEGPAHKRATLQSSWLEDINPATTFWTSRSEGKLGLKTQKGARPRLGGKAWVWAVAFLLS